MNYVITNNILMLHNYYTIISNITLKNHIKENRFETKRL